MEAYDTRPFHSDASARSSFSFAPNRKRFHPVEDLLIPVLGIDAEGTIQHISKAARRLLEYPPDGTIDSYFFSHVHGKNLYRVMQDVAHMVCCGQQQTSWLLRLRTGRSRWRWYRATVHNRLHQKEGHILIRLSEV
jgi:PAS domain-containing protein